MSDVIALLETFHGQHDQKTHGHGSVGEGFTSGDPPEASYAKSLTIDGNPAGRLRDDGGSYYGDGYSSPWSPKDQKVIDRYVVDKNNETIVLNRKMRAGSELTNSEKTRVRALTQLSERGRFTEDARVYRRAEFSDEQLAQFKPGVEFEDRAFMSTSSNPNLAYIGVQSSSSHRGNTMFSIEASANTSAIPMQSSEIVFPPGTRMEILSIRVTDEDLIGVGQFGPETIANAGTTLIRARVLDT